MYMIFIGGIVCILIGVLKIVKFNSYEKVEGKCIKVVERSVGRGGFFFCGKNARYQYLYNDKEYIYQEYGYHFNKKIKEGINYNLRINPKNPSECITPSNIENIIEIFLLGFLMLVISLL